MCIRDRSEDDSGVHFYSHDIIGSEMVKVIMERLKFPKMKIKKAMKLVRWHMFYYPSADWRKGNDLVSIQMGEDVRQGGWTDAAIRRFISNVGEEYIDDLFKIRIADANANPKSNFNPFEIEALQKRIAEVRSKDMALKITDLQVNGYDLESIGVPKGPQMGNILKALLEEVIENPALNTKEGLLDLANNIIHVNGSEKI